MRLKPLSVIIFLLLNHFIGVVNLRLEEVFAAEDVEAGARVILLLEFLRREFVVRAVLRDLWPRALVHPLPLGDLRV